MPKTTLRIEDLVLDSDNPRIIHANGQHQALQKVVKDQRTKLVRLAESIVEHGLSPIEKLMVMAVSARPKRYIALEGNRRVAALRLLEHPAAMTGLDMPSGVQRQMEHLASIFDKSKVEPIDAYEVSSRGEARYWIELRHNGEDQGRGVVAWKPIVAGRYRAKEPAIQAFDLVMEHGGFDEEGAEAIRSKFSLTTLRRLMESRDVRALIGLSVKNGQLHTELPGSELIKPLRRMISDIASKAVESRRFNRTEGMVNYVNSFGKEDRPDLSKKVSERPIEGSRKRNLRRPRRRAGVGGRRPLRDNKLSPKAAPSMSPTIGSTKSTKSFGP